MVSFSVKKKKKIIKQVAATENLGTNYAGTPLHNTPAQSRLDLFREFNEQEEGERERKKHKIKHLYV